jgi:hypothetical protein
MIHLKQNENIFECTRMINTPITTHVTHFPTLHAEDEISIKGHIFRLKSVFQFHNHDEMPQCIELTRYWNGIDEAIQPNRLIPKAFYTSPFYHAMRYSHESFPGQYIVNLCARMAFGTSKLLLQGSNQFEEDSKYYIRLVRMSEHANQLRDIICSYSIKVSICSMLVFLYQQ